MYFILVCVVLLTQGVISQQNTQLYFVDYTRGMAHQVSTSIGRLENLLPRVPISDASAIGVDPVSGHIYLANTHLDWSNTTKFLLKYHPASQSTIKWDLLPSAKVWALGVNHIAQLIFYTDSSDGTMRALNSDFSHDTVIVSGMGIPTGIAVDLAKSLLYWCDANKAFPHIGVSRMDGTQQRNIVVHGIDSPISIALDLKENKIYWCDVGFATVESCTTNGENRQTIVTVDRQQGRHVPWSVAVDDTTIYWVQLGKGTVYKREKLSGASTQALGMWSPDNTTFYQSLKAVTSSTVPSTNACSGSPARGGCQHVCIPTEASRVCRCSDGYTLRNDGTSCKKSSFRQGLLLTDLSLPALMVVDLKDGTIELRREVTWYHSPRGVAIDKDSGHIFWVDGGRRTISKSCLASPCYEQIRVYTDPDSDLNFIDIDSAERRIYVSDGGLKRISRLDYSGLQEATFIDTSPLSPYDIRVDSKNRYIYWIDGLGVMKRTKLDDSTNTEVIHIEPGGIIAFGLDPEAEKVFFISFQKSQIVCIFMNGTGKQILYETNTPGSLVGLTLGHGALYFSDRNAQSIFELNIKTKGTRELLKGRIRLVVGIANYNLDEDEETTLSGTDSDTNQTKSSGGPKQSTTTIIIISVVVIGLIIIVLIVICGVVAYKKVTKSLESSIAEVNIARAPPAKAVKDEEQHELHELPPAPPLPPTDPTPSPDPPSPQYVNQGRPKHRPPAPLPKITTTLTSAGPTPPSSPVGEPGLVLATRKATTPPLEPTPWALGVSHPPGPSVSEIMEGHMLIKQHIPHAYLQTPRGESYKEVLS